VELPHRGFSSDDAWNIETELVYSLLEVDKNDIRENLEAIPATIDDNLTAIPDLTGVSHSWLGQLMLIHFWLRPCLLFYTFTLMPLLLLTGIEDEDVVYDPLLSVSLSSSKNDQVLAKLGARMAVPCGRWLTHGLTWINL